MNSVEVNVNSDASSADDVWNTLNEGESWDDFETSENNWWDGEEEVNWETDVLSGEKIEVELATAELQGVIDDFKNGAYDKKPIKSAESSSNVRKIDIVNLNEKAPITGRDG